MNTVLVDSNVLFDILTNDERWQPWSSQALNQAASNGRLIINPIIFGEVSVGFPTIGEVEDVLPSTMFERERIPYDAAFLAAKALAAYRRRGGYKILTRDVARYRTYFPNLTLIAP
ncbi:DNA-binding protein [Reyranella sp.]|uniref:DNA-binding protein n=1 Tax=Reyranella sp. TaxID=1929291 RepID=UPI003D0F6552